MLSEMFYSFVPRSNSEWCFHSFLNFISRVNGFIKQSTGLLESNVSQWPQQLEKLDALRCVSMTDVPMIILRNRTEQHENQYYFLPVARNSVVCEVMSAMEGAPSRDDERSNAVSVRISHTCGWETEEKHERPTEVLRLQLERTGTIDDLTRWLEKIVELPPDKRPKDALEFLKKHFSPWHGNVRNVALQNMLNDIQKEIAEVKEENEELKRQIADIETALLARKLGALNATAEQRKAIAAAEQAARSFAENNPTQKKGVKNMSKPKPFDSRHFANNAVFSDVPGPSTINSPAEGMLVPIHNVAGPSTSNPSVPVVHGNPKVTVKHD
ncbi:hypothetical protein Y032_0759g2112 [Ancylostoma ceylanicum]|uniref:Uncharacterized protein n=2 Tax=Ancylostoma ceylanicum TaxID=53326 RepID=A0A016WE43_9BILA|nr:hypothetical protein Y032_0759g2112 [Ancylostoma ceylanicum]